MYQKVTAASLNSWWNPKTLHQYKNSPLGLYQPGDYPVPFWKYGPSCRLTPRRPGIRPRSALGDAVTSTYDPSLWIDSGAGGQPVPTAIGIAPGSVPGGYSSASDEAILNSIINQPVPLPGVSAATLLQAASLPSAPAIVKQAAAQYTAANPATSVLQASSLVPGVPNYLLLAGAGLLLVVVVAAGSSKKR